MFSLNVQILFEDELTLLKNTMIYCGSDFLYGDHEQKAGASTLC